MPLVFTQLASDNFQRPDESPLSNGGLWSSTDDVAGDGPPFKKNGLAQLRSGAVTNLEDGRFSQSLWLGPENFTNDQYSEFTYLAADQVTYHGPIVRAQTVDYQSGYKAIVEPFAQTGTALVFIDRQDNSGPANPSARLATGEFPCQLGDVLRIAAVGNVISFYINGVQKLTVVDNTYASGKIGFGTFHYFLGTRNNNAISSWAGGMVSPALSEVDFREIESSGEVQLQSVESSGEVQLQSVSLCPKATFGELTSSGEVQITSLDSV